MLFQETLWAFPTIPANNHLSRIPISVLPAGKKIFFPAKTINRFWLDI